MRVLTWNLMHGRAVPGAGRDLLEEFAATLAQWDWELALLQEVPPWWPERLARGTGADWRLALTSRNFGRALRRAVAVRWPDLIKSNGGGCNAILLRGPRTVAEHRAARLGWLPERRWLHAVRLSDGWWAGNLHTEASAAQSRQAAAILRAWAGPAPAILGGDFNLAELSLPGFERAGGHGVDQVFVRGLVAGETRVLERGPLSDHAPVVVSVGARGPEAAFANDRAAVNAWGTRVRKFALCESRERQQMQMPDADAPQEKMPDADADDQRPPRKQRLRPGPQEKMPDADADDQVCPRGPAQRGP